MNAISAKVLKEILTNIVQAGNIPSDSAIKELAAAAGLSEQALRNDFARYYKAAGNDDDPFGPLPFIIT